MPIQYTATRKVKKVLNDKFPNHKFSVRRKKNTPVDPQITIIGEFSNPLAKKGEVHRFIRSSNDIYGWNHADVFFKTNDQVN